MGDKSLPTPVEKHGIIAKLTSFIVRVCPIPPTPRIELMGVTGRLQAFNRKNRLVIYLGVSTLFVLFGYMIAANILTPLTISDFHLQVTRCNYNPSTGSFSVWGTIEIPVPRHYYYWLGFVSIIDGNNHHRRSGSWLL